MTWSYSNSLLTTKDRVRLLIGDVESDDPLISDEAIGLYEPGGGGSLEQITEVLAAAAICDLIATRLIRRANEVSAGATRLSFSDQAKAYRERAAELRGGTSAVPAALIGSLALVGNDPPGGEPIFTRTLGDYP